nr:TetR/AcrR family transcriptional regulator [uncultured Caproiciproducens sp.]
MIENAVETREKLLQSAKQEFLLNGFEKASLRTICKNAGLTTGALYFFFENKEDLFDCLVKDAASELKKMMASFAQTEKVEYQSSISSSESKLPRSDIDHEKALMRYLYANKDAFVLLTSMARGSSYDGFYREMIQFMEQLFSEFVCLYHSKKIADSPMMKNAVRCMVSFRIHAYLELLQSNIPLEEALSQAEIIASYAVGGFENVMNHIKQKYT